MVLEDDERSEGECNMIYRSVILKGNDLQHNGVGPLESLELTTNKTTTLSRIDQLFISYIMHPLTVPLLAS